MSNLNEFDYVHTAASSPNGPEGLLLSTILLAASEVGDEDPAIRDSARRYFALPLYVHHLIWLGLEPSLLPAFFQGQAPLPSPDLGPVELEYLRWLLRGDDEEAVAARAALTTRDWARKLMTLRAHEARGREGR